MGNLARGLSVAAVLMAVFAIGLPSEKSGITITTPSPSTHYETATLAGGCFWGLQASLGQLSGVIKTTVGYTGGTTPDPTYETVVTDKTGYAEAIQVVFDPTKLSYRDLLSHFFSIHDPTSPHHPAKGAEVHYRSAIFYHSPEQRRIAEHVTEQVVQSHKWKYPVVTEITPATKFYPAEAYFQDHVRSCSVSRD